VSGMVGNALRMLIGFWNGATTSAAQPADLAPTIRPALFGEVNTSAAPFLSAATLPKVGEARRVAPACDPPEAAASFVRWAYANDLAPREWTVDDVWFLAAEDFAPAHGLKLPPRRVFLGALQKVPGVAVAYDRRRYARDGRLLGKTTFYRLAPDAEAGDRFERLAA